MEESIGARSCPPFAELIRSAMSSLALRRPVFHSEADFQLALGWEIQALEPAAGIRLERRILRDPVVAVDILLVLQDEIYAIELKYLKAPLEVEIDGEPFRLAAGAPDIERYDFLRDVARLERVVGQGLAYCGCALLLTNASGFWRPGGERATAFDALRIHEGQRLAGRLEWGASAGAGTRRGREASIELTGQYECWWEPYSTAGSESNAEFRYLSLIVDGDD